MAITSPPPPETLTDWLARRRQAVAAGASTAAPITIERGHGAEAWDVDGRRYIDFAGGIGTLNVGHTPERVVRRIQEQAEKLLHMSFAVSYYEPYIELAERLAQVTPGRFAKQTLLLNSGAEAVENAVKIARAATGRRAIISFENAFHGRTLMAMSLTGKEKPYKLGFGPFAPEVYHARFPYRYRCDCAGGSCAVENGQDLERLFATTVNPTEVAAIIVEPVQGEGGFVVAPPEWLRLLEGICRAHGILLIVDEVQTGFGRTGTLFCSEQSGIEPDLIVLAKSIAAGLPLGAVVGRAELMSNMPPGTVGGTFGGNPLACVAALEVLDMFEEEGLLESSRHIGEIVRERFDLIARRHPLVGEVRGLGAMQAMELVKDRETKEPAKEETAAILRDCLENGLIVLKAGLYDNVIRFLAPLVIEEHTLHEGLDILEGAFARV